MHRLLTIIYTTAALFLVSTEVWSLPPCPTDQPVTDWMDCFGSYTFVSGTKFIGEWKGGKPNGPGTHTFINGAKYVGEWKDGLQNGQGTYTFVNGSKYIGEWKDGKRHGQGAFTWIDGRKYVGKYKDGKRHGHGAYTHADGRIAEGIWEKGKFLYAAKITIPGKPRSEPKVAQFPTKGKSSYETTIIRKSDKEICTGVEYGSPDYIKVAKRRMLTNKYCDLLTETEVGQSSSKPKSSTGVSRLPPCLSDQLTEFWTECFAPATFANGVKYVGEWKDGKRHGQGAYTYASSAKYVGEWKDGKKHGQGAYTYASGARYVGEFKDGEMHGQGAYTYPNGAKYVGQFKDGKVQGHGTYTNTDGSIAEGLWENGKFFYAQKITSPPNPKPVSKAPPAPPKPDISPSHANDTTPPDIR